MDLVHDIVFEKQEGNLCAQHALNVLLQGSYFTAVDLATIGEELDRTESLISGSIAKRENYDDTGFFSIQVIQRALSIWDLTLVPWLSEEASNARECPEQEKAYICNLHQHWFTLRKFSVPWRWYNLNSTQNMPAHLSETYLELLLEQIQNEGYSVFVVRGPLMASVADRRALELPRPEKTSQDKTKTLKSFSGQGYSLVSRGSESNINENSSQGTASQQNSLQQQQQDMEEMRRKRLARFGG
ncbi:Josephin-domain-containing protein [Spinellus fusiger]|nr:Josephin-domain-containing protein [Spinellus fusiger]